MDNEFNVRPHKELEPGRSERLGAEARGAEARGRAPQGSRSAHAKVVGTRNNIFGHAAHPHLHLDGRVLERSQHRLTPGCIEFREVDREPAQL